MKFARQLEEYQLPEWRGRYLPYDLLKKALADIASGRCSAAMERLQRSPSPEEQGSWPGSGISSPMSPGARVHRRTVQLTMPQASSEERELAAQLWWSRVEAEAFRIGTCVNHRLQELLTQAGELSAVPCESCSIVELQVLEGLQRLYEGCARLRSFAELNHAALFKIAKKHDKALGGDRGLAAHLPRLVGESGLGDHKQLEDLEARLRASMLECSQCQGLEASPRVAMLATCLVRGQQHAGGSGVDPMYLRGERMRFFFLGSCLALLLAIVALISLPPMQPETFDTAYFLASFPVFHVVWSVLLIFWCMGAISQVCDDHFINHIFILSVDPRCRATSSYFFGKAAFLTSLWILSMGMYILDYKWMLFPTELQTRELFRYRSSWHFVLYPLVLLSVALLMMLWPSKICRVRYKLQLLRCVGRTCLAPLYAVSFADNLVGDVMTSLAKPFIDIPTAICYLASHHPQRPEDIQRYIKDGNICPSWEHHILEPLISGAPFLFRLLQCARRYHDTREGRHLLNLGKYMSSLLVLVVTWTFRHGQGVVAVVAVSLVATIYAATWDICMDWGLDRAFLRSACARRRQANPGAAGRGSLEGTRELSGDLLHAECLSGAEAGGQCPSASPAGPVAARRDGQAAAPQADGTPRRASAKSMERRLFSVQTYCIAACLDVTMRLAWVLSLFPLSLLSDDIVQRAVLGLFVATVEIFRRSMWTVFRIENEQVNNASGFRALHWVPLQLSSLLPQQ